MMQLERIDRRGAGRRVIVAASGPSLTPEVADLCLGEFAIAVNDAYRLLPWAFALYACDTAWWEDRDPEFAGERWTSHSLSPKNDKTMVAPRLGLRVVEGADNIGFSRDPGRIHYGNNSGFQAVNLALLWGFDPVILVGFDMRAVDKQTHFFGRHRPPLHDTPGSFGKWIGNFTKAAEMLGHPRPTILNATPGSALKCFPMVDDLAATLRDRVAA